MESVGEDEVRRKSFYRGGRGKGKVEAAFWGGGGKLLLLDLKAHLWEK